MFDKFRVWNPDELIEIDSWVFVELLHATAKAHVG